jgi:hypothetical protein
MGLPHLFYKGAAGPLGLPPPLAAGPLGLQGRQPIRVSGGVASPRCRLPWRRLPWPPPPWPPALGGVPPPYIMYPPWSNTIIPLYSNPFHTSDTNIEYVHQSSQDKYFSFDSFPLFKLQFDENASVNVYGHLRFR